MADTNELKPCPFCGSKNVMAFARTCNKDSKYNPADRAFPIVRCRECGACSEGRDWSEPITAITKWNERATAATPLPADAALADALKEVEHTLWQNGFTRSAETVRSAAARLRALSQPAELVFADNGIDIEARMAHDAENACPACGGSGHADDVPEELRRPATVAQVPEGFVLVDISLIDDEWMQAAMRDAGIVRNIGAPPETIMRAAISGYLLAASQSAAPSAKGCEG